MRGWSNDKTLQVFPRGTRAGGAAGAGAPARLPVAVGGDLLDRGEVRWDFPYHLDENPVVYRVPEDLLELATESPKMSG